MHLYSWCSVFPERVYNVVNSAYGTWEICWHKQKDVVEYCMCDCECDGAAVTGWNGWSCLIKGDSLCYRRYSVFQFDGKVRLHQHSSSTYTVASVQTESRLKTNVIHFTVFPIHFSWDFVGNSFLICFNYLFCVFLSSFYSTYLLRDRLVLCLWSAKCILVWISCLICL